MRTCHDETTMEEKKIHSVVSRVREEALEPQLGLSSSLSFTFISFYFPCHHHHHHHQRRKRRFPSRFPTLLISYSSVWHYDTQVIKLWVELSWGLDEQQKMRDESWLRHRHILKQLVMSMIWLWNETPVIYLDGLRCCCLLLLFPACQLQRPIRLTMTYMKVHWFREKKLVVIEVYCLFCHGMIRHYNLYSKGWYSIFAQ